MKKLLLLISIFFTTLATAQTVRLQGGPQLSTLYYKDMDGRITDGVKSRPSFHVGAVAEWEIADAFSFETGLLYSGRGMKVDSYFDGKVNLILHQLEIPLVGKMYFDVGSQRLYGVFGPYIGINLAGKYKPQGEDVFGGYQSAYKLDIGSDQNQDLKRIDAGLKLGGGIELGPLQVGLFYNLGLANNSPYTGERFSMKQGVFGVSASYKIFKP
jgi:hypothetical protein